MNQARALLAVGAVVFVLTLIAVAPARLIDVLGGDELRLGGASGTVWRGSASQVTAGPLRLGRTEWRIRVLPLLIGRIAATLDTELPGGFARGKVSLGLAGTLRVNDLEAAAPLESLGVMFGFPNARGDAVVNLQTAELRDGWPKRLVGSLRLGNVPLDISGGGVAPAINLLADFDAPEPDDGGEIPGRVSDQGGPLQIAGTIRLFPPANYAIDARVGPRADAPPEVRQGLALLGPADPQGDHRFQMSGSL